MRARRSESESRVSESAQVGGQPALKDRIEGWAGGPAGGAASQRHAARARRVATGRSTGWSPRLSRRCPPSHSGQVTRGAGPRQARLIPSHHRDCNTS